MDSCSPSEFLRVDCAAVAGRRTIANLWRDAVAEARPRPGVPPRGRRRVGARSRGPRRRGGRRARERPPRARRPQGRRVRDPRRRTRLEWALFDFALALVGAVGAPIYAIELGARRAVRPRALRGGRRPRRGRRAAGEGRGARSSHVVSYAGLDGLRASGRQYAAGHPEALRERADSIDEDDLFTFIYTSGTTGPPKACMIRHRNYYAMVQKGDEMDDRLIVAGRRDAPLPPARPQLRAAAAPLAAPTSASRSRSCPTRCGPRPSCRACARRVFPSVPRVYEKIHAAVAARVRRDESGAQAAARRLGARRRRRASRVAPGGAAGPRALARAAPARRQARLLEGEGAARRPAARRERRRRAALARDRRVLPRDRHPDPRGLRALRGDDGGDRQPHGRLQVRHRRQAAARRRARGSPRTARS